MTGEQTLRALAEHRRRMVLGATPEHHEALILGARPFLSGAVMALVGAKVLDHPAPLQLLEELLAPIEQPLVDSGAIDRMSVSLKADEIASLFFARRRTRAIAITSSFGDRSTQRGQRITLS